MCRNEYVYQNGLMEAIIEFPFSRTVYPFFTFKIIPLLQFEETFSFLITISYPAMETSDS